MVHSIEKGLPKFAIGFKRIVYFIFILSALLFNKKTVVKISVLEDRVTKPLEFDKTIS